MLAALAGFFAALGSNFKHLFKGWFAFVYYESSFCFSFLLNHSKFAQWLLIERTLSEEPKWAVSGLVALLALDAILVWWICFKLNQIQIKWRTDVLRGYSSPPRVLHAVLSPHRELWNDVHDGGHLESWCALDITSHDSLLWKPKLWWFVGFRICLESCVESNVWPSQSVPTPNRSLQWLRIPFRCQIIIYGNNIFAEFKLSQNSAMISIRKKHNSELFLICSFYWNVTARNHTTDSHFSKDLKPNFDWRKFQSMKCESNNNNCKLFLSVFQSHLKWRKQQKPIIFFIIIKRRN